ncbi:18738_t:CDS:2, partial [Gigaspora rosea]
RRISAVTRSRRMLCCIVGRSAIVESSYVDASFICRCRRMVGVAVASLWVGVLVIAGIVVNSVLLSLRVVAQ